MNTESIKIDINDGVADLILSAINFPAVIDITPQKSAFTDQATLGEVSADFTEEESDTELDELGAALDSVLLDGIESYRNGSLIDDVLTSEEKEFLTSFEQELQSSKNELTAERYIATAEGTKLVEKLIRSKRFKFEVVWAKLTIADRPNLQLANPIVVSGISTRVQVKVKACVRIFGRWRCLKITTPRLRFDAKKVNVALQGRSSELLGYPSFNNLDFVITIRIFGFRFKIKIGLTTIVNRELRKKGPVTVIDLSDFSQDIPYSSAKLKIKEISPIASSSSLGVEAVLGLSK